MRRGSTTEFEKGPYLLLCSLSLEEDEIIIGYQRKSLSKLNGDGITIKFTLKRNVNYG
jgi:hypothetical protein